MVIKIDIHYHQVALELAYLEPITSEKRLEQIAEREQFLGFKLPAALKEWYAIEDAESWLAGINGDWPVSLQGLGNKNEWFGYEFDFVQAGYLVIRNEVQFVCKWAVPIDKQNWSEDPPVVAIWPEKNGTFTVKPCSDSFSKFVYGEIWDSFWTTSNYAAYGSYNFPTENGFSFLREVFREIPQSYYFPDTIIYRFDSKDKYVLIHHQENKESFWWIWADSETALIELLVILQSFDGLVEDLQPSFEKPEVVEKILETFQDI